MKRTFLLLIAATIVAAAGINTTYAGNRHKERVAARARERELQNKVASIEEFWRKKAEDSAYCARFFAKLESQSYTNCYREVREGNQIFYDYGRIDDGQKSFGMKKNMAPYILTTPIKEHVDTLSVTDEAGWEQRVPLLPQQK